MKNEINDNIMYTNNLLYLAVYNYINSKAEGTKH